MAPLRYLAIHHAEKRYDVVVPLVLGVLAWGAFWFVEPRPALFGPEGLFAAIKDVLVMAVPFLIGALATVAMGAPGPHIDRRSPGSPIELDGRLLSLRQFVCYLLGYLSFLGLLNLGIVIAAQLCAPAMATWAASNPTGGEILTILGTLGISLLISTLLVTVFWALYFLTDIVARSE